MGGTGSLGAGANGLVGSGGACLVGAPDGMVGAAGGWPARSTIPGGLRPISGGMGGIRGILGGWRQRSRTRANDLARNRHLSGKVRRMRASTDWKDAGDLKRALIDMLMQERNETAKRVMLDIEGQRQARLQ